LKRIDFFINAIKDCEYFTILSVKDISKLPMMNKPIVIGTMKDGEKKIFIIEEYSWKSFEDNNQDFFTEKFIPHEHLESWGEVGGRKK